MTILMNILFHTLVAWFTLVHRIQNAADSSRHDARQLRAQLTAWAHPNPYRPNGYQGHHHKTSRSRQLRATTTKTSYTLAGGGQ